MRLLPLALLLLLAGCLGGGDGADPAPSAPALPVSATGQDCEESVLLLRVPVAQVRHEVPERFALVGEATGQATLRVAALDCAGFGVDGGATRRSVLSEAAVAVDVAGMDGEHGYLLWALSDDAAWARVLDSVGAPGGLLPSFTTVRSVEEAGPVLVGSVQTGVPWPEGSHRISLRLAGGPGVPPTARHLWLEAPFGTVRIDVEATAQAAAAATGEFEAQGRAADLAGASATGTGTFVRGDYAFQVVAT